MADGEHRDERQRGGVEDDLNGVTVERGEAGHGGRAAFAELAGALDGAEEIGGPRSGARIEDPRERVHDVVGRDLAAMVELHALPERERPREAVARGLPELGERGCYGQRVVELDQAVEDLLRHRATVDVADTRRIERRRLVPERPSVDATIDALIGGAGAERQRGDEGDNEEEGDHPDPLPPKIVGYEPPPSAVPMAWKNCVVPEDSITGAASRNDARTRSAATSLPIALLLEARIRLDDGPSR